MFQVSSQGFVKCVVCIAVIVPAETVMANKESVTEAQFLLGVFALALPLSVAVHGARDPKRPSIDLV